MSGNSVAPYQPTVFTTHRPAGFTVRRYTFLRDFKIINCILYTAFSFGRRSAITVAVSEKPACLLALMYRFVARAATCFLSLWLYRPSFLLGVNPSNPIEEVYKFVMEVLEGRGVHRVSREYSVEMYVLEIPSTSSIFNPRSSNVFTDSTALLAA